ncbi:MAG: hypothetical protein ACE3JN_14235 [Ectobacillus sp.]
MLTWNERRRLQREKRLGPARGKRPPVVENQPSSLTELKMVLIWGLIPLSSKSCHAPTYYLYSNVLILLQVSPSFKRNKKTSSARKMDDVFTLLIL